MLLVNNVIWTEATPRQLMHAKWNQGVTFTDMIFPWFLFAMGLAIPLSGAAQEQRGVGRWSQTLRVIRRSMLLVILGMLLDSSLAGRPVIGLGVLQLLGLTYLVGALAWPLPIWARLGMAVGLLAAHWALIRFVPVPGVGAGLFVETQNIIRYLNQTYLGRYHLTGLLSVVPTSALVLIGTALGDLLRASSLRPVRKTALLLLGGTILMAAGMLWSRDLPFNKPVWTAPYILLAAGLGAILLGVYYLLFDVAGWRWLAFPFVVFGANAIVVYIASIVFKVYVLQEWHYRSAAGDVISLQQAILTYLTGRVGRMEATWLYTIGFIMFWWIVLLYLHRRRIFVRV
jgi:predicted acyltransferase